MEKSTNNKEWFNSFKELLFPLHKTDVKMDEAFKLKYENIPKSLFKYCNFDEGEFNVKNLYSDTVWLSNPSTFNDPYDCLFSLENIDDLSKKMNEDNVQRYLLECQEDINAEEKQKILENETPYLELKSLLLSKKLLTEENFEYLDKMIKDEILDDIELLNQNMKKTYKVSCFSEKNDLILMWSHYSDNHTGFCIEYEKDESFDFKEFFKSLYPINYSDKLFDITDYYKTSPSNRNISYLIQGLITKSTHWDYEKEWRLIQIGSLSGGLSFSMPKVKAIYLGSKISPKNLVHMKKIAKAKKINLYKMELNKIEYKLVEKEVLLVK